SLFLSSPPAPIHIYPLSLHDALPILTTTPESSALRLAAGRNARPSAGVTRSTEKKLLETTSIATISPRPLVLTKAPRPPCARTRSEEHTSELQSRFDLVCRLLLEKKK